MLNEYLNSFMLGLSSKVWRTCNASIHFQNFLNKINKTVLEAMNNNEN